MERCQYRGYQIETRRLWSNWCVSVYRTRSDIPILPQPTLHTPTPRIHEAVAEAKCCCSDLVQAAVSKARELGWIV